MEAVGAYLRALRDAQKKSRASVAAMIHTHESQIVRIEAGDQDSRGSLLLAFVDAVRGRVEDIQALALNKDATAEDGKRLAASLRARLEASDTETRKQELNRIADELERDPRRLDRLIGYGERLLEEDRERGSR